jgi:hypothetical protein
MTQLLDQGDQPFFGVKTTVIAADSDNHDAISPATTKGFSKHIVIGYQFA